MHRALAERTTSVSPRQPGEPAANHFAGQSCRRTRNVDLGGGSPVVVRRTRPSAAKEWNGSAGVCWREDRGWLSGSGQLAGLILYWAQAPVVRRRARPRNPRRVQAARATL